MKKGSCGDAKDHPNSSDRNATRTELPSIIRTANAHRDSRNQTGTAHVQINHQDKKKL